MRNATSAMSSLWSSPTNASSSSSHNCSTGRWARCRGGACESLEAVLERLGPPFDETVRVEDDRAPGGEVGDRLRTTAFRIGDRERPAAPLVEEARATVRVDDERGRMTGRRVAERACSGIHDAVQQRRCLRAFDAVREAIEPGDRFDRGVGRTRQCAEGATELAHDRSRVDAAPDDVAHCNRDATAVEGNDLVPVAAD